jgi:type IV pilus assembly protein PilF
MRSVFPRSAVILAALRSTALVAALLAACAGRNKPSTDADGVSAADKHYDVAVGSFHQGMFHDAKLQLEKALTADPKHADSYYLRGILLLQEGKTLITAIEGEQCLEDVAADRQRERAQSLHRQAGKAFESAIANYTDGAAGRGRAYNSLAVVDLHFHENERAVEHARKALEQKFYADRYSALSNLGWAFYQAGDLVSATAELRQAVLMNPDYCVGRYRLAQVYLEVGAHEAAIEQAAVVAGDPRCPIQDAHRILGAARLRSGHDADASAAFASCVELAPRSCLAHQCERMIDGDRPADRSTEPPVATAHDEVAQSGP